MWLFQLGHLSLFCSVVSDVPMKEKDMSFDGREPSSP